MATRTRRSFPWQSSALAALALGLPLAASGCGAAGSSPPRGQAPSSCDPGKLDVCERAIGDALSKGRVARETIVAYTSARSAADPNDPWAALWGALAADVGRGDAAVIVEEAPSAGAARSVTAPHRAIQTTAKLPEPKAIAADDLLLAMGGAAALSHIIHVRGAPTEVTELFPVDPIEPFMAGARPILRGDAEPSSIDVHIRLAALAKSAVEAAGAFDYIKAATEGDALSTRLKAPPVVQDQSEPVARARYISQLLDAAGLGLDPEGDGDDGAIEAPKAEGPPKAPLGSAYGDLTRVRIAKDPSAEWALRGSSILAATPADRRDALPTLFRKANDCSALRAPPMDRSSDLIYGGRLAGALDKGGPAASGLATGGAASPDARLPLPEWYRRYEVFARAVSETRSMWFAATSLLYERGEIAGLSPASTSTYARVTELGAKHISAMQALERALPGRYRAFSNIGLVYSPGVLGDAKLREAVVRLTQTTVQDKLGRAGDAKGVFEGALTGVFAGVSYPPAIQEAHYMALQGAFAAKLKGDMLTRAGWGVAGLYAADAIFRIITDQSPNLEFSSAQVARSLSDKSIVAPSLAALASSVARYAALGAEGRLDPELAKIERFPPERRAAREALKNAIAGLGALGEAPANVLEDVTELADGLIATLSLSIRERRAAKAGDAAACAQKASASGPSPAVRRAVARLSDVRRRVLLHPRYKDGSGAWVSRARLVVTLLSDAMDILGKTGARPSFTITDEAAERALADALRGWDERAAADAIGGAYALARRGFAARDAGAFVKQNGPNLRRVLRGLALFFKGDEAPAGKPSAGVSMLEALAALPLTTGNDADLTSQLVSYAEAFYAKDQVDQGDLWLLSTLVLSGLTESPPPEPVLALAAKRSPRLSWALRFIADVSRARTGSLPDPSAYEAGMREATDDACAVADASDVLTVMGAIRGFESGDPAAKAKARADLDRALAAMEERGLNVPKMTYKYEEKTATRVFSATLGLSYGAGLLEGAHTFQLGVGVKSRGEPEGSMTATLSPPDAALAGEEAARYYIHAAALAAAYHFLEGDAAHATAAARRAIDALAFGVRLGGRSMPAADPVAWGADARALLALDAQLAAEADLPFLAGDLWTMVRGSLAKDAGDSDVADVLDTAPFGLAAVKEAAPARERAAKSLKVLAAPLACTEVKVELGAFEETTCEAYPLALSLRIGDALKKLPRLRPGGGSSRRCVSARALDAFLSAAEKGTYDPDAFTSAVEERKADGDVYSAAVLLARQRRDAHCSPVIVKAARALAAETGRALGPSLRADLLGAAVNCSLAGSSTDPAVIDDLLALDAETQRLPDLTRNLRLLLSVTDLAVSQNKEAPLIAIATRAGFVDRWMRVNPAAATLAMLIEHAARTLSGSQADAEMSRGSGAYTLLCETFPPGERAATCAAIKALRPPFTGSVEARRNIARQALIKLLADASAPGPPASGSTLKP